MGQYSEWDASFQFWNNKAILYKIIWILQELFENGEPKLFYAFLRIIMFTSNKIRYSLKYINNKNQ
jgi:hypothetical protein